MAEFKAIETQEQFDAAIKKRIEQAERSTREEFKDYLSPDDVKKLKDSFAQDLETAKETAKTEVEKLKNQISENSEKLGKYSEMENMLHESELKVLKYSAVHEAGIPFEFAERLVGNTKEELLEDAKNLSAFVKTTAAPPLRIPNDSGAEGTVIENSLRSVLSGLNNNE